MDPYPHGTKHLKGKEWWKAQGTIVLFMSVLTVIWLLHVLVMGWFSYFFMADGYIIRAGDIAEDVENRGTKWWNKYHCEAALKAATMNNPDDLVMFTWRTHPFFLDNDILYIQSKGYAARVWDEREKIYHFR